ncbi:hypothetical protein N7532_010599 [Penicillium argentinense]|uniref:Uncharacterized protein n=1 Tax=Penicillium argentinense TaxID=1131581 RepID=A0A9W9JY36_9EURO|nr:uncharacterized protein N7532_010599 [Penicillium argentinense]KAJ5085828.1 hypothetical protein N7532_010599 [Penicillium argentinense]
MKYSIVFSAVLAGLAMASPTKPSDCKPNEHRDNHGNCAANMVTRDVHLAELGQACHINSDCTAGLECIKDICAKVNIKRDGPLGQQCHTDNECAKGLVCEKDVCLSPKSKRENAAPQGQNCHATFDCREGLVCEKDTHCPQRQARPCKLNGDCVKCLVCNYDNTCVAPKDKRAVIGDECETEADCQSPNKLICQVVKGNKVCAAPQK